LIYCFKINRALQQPSALGICDAPWAWQQKAMGLGHHACALGIYKIALDAPWAF